MGDLCTLISSLSLARNQKEKKKIALMANMWSCLIAPLYVIAKKNLNDAEQDPSFGLDQILIQLY